MPVLSSELKGLGSYFQFFFCFLSGVRSEYCVSFGWNEADDLIGHSSIDTHSVTVLQCYNLV